MYKDENKLLRTNLRDWEEINRILVSVKGKQKVRSSDQIVQDLEKKGKNRMKRAMRILDVLNNSSLKHDGNLRSFL